jgi:hypothetical protein
MPALLMYVVGLQFFIVGILLSGYTNTPLSWLFVGLAIFVFVFMVIANL